MTELPLMPLDIEAYVLKTTHLTLEQHGAYMLLLIAAWRVKGLPQLPNDDRKLARILGITPKKWASLKPVVMSFWRLDSGFWTQNKQLEVRRAVNKKLEQKRAAANARWGDKSLIDNDAGDAGAYADGYAADHAAAMHLKSKTLPTEENTGPKGPVSEAKSSDAPTKRGSNKTYPEEFDLAWSKYPARENQSKLKAFAAWSRLEPEDRAKVTAAIPGFIAFCRKDPTYRPVHMVRFITERRFDNYTGGERAKSATADDWVKRLSFARTRSQWDSLNWGPPPGKPGCLVPSELIEPPDGIGWAEWQQH